VQEPPVLPVQSRGIEPAARLSFFSTEMHFGLLLLYCYTVHTSARLTSHKIPVATRCKAWVCGRSLVGIAGSNRVGGIDVLSFMLCVVSATGRSIVQRIHT